MYRTADFLQQSKRDVIHSFIHIPRTANYLDRVELEEEKITIPKSDVIDTV